MKNEFIETILKLKEVPQSPKWHPEGDTFEHIKFIIFGLWINLYHGYISNDEYEFLTWVALFHDLGKIDTLTFDDNGNPHAYGHEYKARGYINKFNESIPAYIDIEKLKKFCESHMKAHLMMGDKMRVSKKEAFRDSFDTERDFYLMMVFESCDSSITLYESLRRDEMFINECYLPPIEFYNSIRATADHYFDTKGFEAWLRKQ